MRRFPFAARAAMLPRMTSANAPDRAARRRVPFMALCVAFGAMNAVGLLPAKAGSFPGVSRGASPFHPRERRQRGDV
ncbi:protein of unknown function [Methylocella tundrae]|uniref:Uncharacterized protein n=1 Tax=Methylocella tundrae TaxID=227605 RepID=A0A4U8YZQ5_METTU|nr:protein of unknown function [Methylocella tundrae]